MAVATKADYTENTIVSQLRNAYDIEKLKYLRNRLSEQISFMNKRIINNDKVQFSDVNKRKIFSEIMRNAPKLAEIINETASLRLDEKVKLVKRAIELAIEEK